jgi:regulator of sigma E protease
MSLIIFIIVLSLLVIVHELGHFLLAKMAGVRVDEFGLGFPPKIASIFRLKGTIFTLNWIPFGGFVKIYGENYAERKDEKSAVTGWKLFTSVSKLWQIAILLAGVAANFILAWILLTAGFLIGLPYSANNDRGYVVDNAHLTITNIMPDSPAELAELKAGDVITDLVNSKGKILDISHQSVADFISSSAENVTLEILRNDEKKEFTITPSESLTSGKFAIGVHLDEVGLLRLPLHLAVLESGRASYYGLIDTAKGLGTLLLDTIRGRPDLSQITGPVGIIGIVGEASRLGWPYIITLTAFISLNLVVINILPLPALDGGRVLFVLIEILKGTPIKKKVFNWANSISFAILIGLMLIITFRDIKNLF